jgi:hypothetical protein
MRCPGCRTAHVYYSHDIGAAAKCERCGARFVYQEQPFRMMGVLALAVIAIVGTILFWVNMFLVQLLKAH